MIINKLNQKEIEDLKLQIVYAKIDLKNAKSLVREDGTIVLRYHKFISLDEYEKAIKTFIQECEDKIRKLKQKGDNYVTNTD